MLQKVQQIVSSHNGKNLSKTKSTSKNENIVMEESTKLSTTRTIRKEKWDKKQYIMEGEKTDITEIMKKRLQIQWVPLCRNMQDDRKQCRLCLLHGQNINELLKASKYIQAVTLLH